MPDAEQALGQLPNRADKALAFVNLGGKGIEIGPADNPLVPKRDGFDVRVVDHLTTEELRASYAAQGADVDAIEEVDVVWQGEPLTELVGPEHAYDWIVASHVLEHIPDPISFLQACQRLLRPGGVLSLVLPDKRFSFDFFRPLSTTGELLDAFHERRRRPTPGNVYDHHRYAVARGGAIGWGIGDPNPLQAIHDMGGVRAMWEHADRSGEYVDVHIWTFIPESLPLILTDLRSIGLTTLGIRGEFPGGAEFFVSLTPDWPMAEGPDGVAVLAAVQAAADWVSIHGSVAAAGANGVAEANDVAETERPSISEETPTEEAPASMRVSRRERALLTGKRQLMSAVRTLAGAVSASRRPRPS